MDNPIIQFGLFCEGVSWIVAIAFCVCALVIEIVGAFIEAFEAWRDEWR